MSADPLAGNASDPQSLNLYTYVRNNPANLVDPSGLCAESFWGGSCNDFGISITWGWSSGRDDAPTPLHPHPTRPPSRTGPSPHVAYGFLPGETAGVPNWVTGRSDLSRWVIMNFSNQNMARLKKISDFSAGAGDVISLGLTYVIRKYVWCHCDDVVDKSSGAYIAGAGTGVAIGVALSGPRAGCPMVAKQAWGF